MPREEPESLIDLFLPLRPTLFELPPVYLTPENVERLRGQGIRVFTNAMGEETERPYVAYQYLLYRGADIIQTDHLDQLVPYLHIFNATRGAGQKPSTEPSDPGSLH